MKTTRDIKSSLVLGRQQQVPSRTRFIEDNIRTELAGELGGILDENERSALEEREYRRAETHALALKRSKIQILRAKEKARIMQEIRGDRARSGRRRGRRLKGKPTKPSGKKNFNEISVEY